MNLTKDQVTNIIKRFNETSHGIMSKIDKGETGIMSKWLHEIIVNNIIH